MTLRELLGDGPDVVVTGLTFDNRLVADGHPVLLRPGLHPRRARLRARRGRARARPRWSCSGRWGSACPRCWSTTCGPRWRVAAARFYGDPTRDAARRGHHRHQRQDDDRVPDPRAAGGRGAVDAGCSGRSSRSSAASSTRSCARRPRRSTSSARSARCSTPATSRARWRSPRTRWSSSAPTRIHVAAAVFTNLTQDHLDFHPTMEDYFQAKRLLFASPLTAVRIANADDPLRAAADRGVRRP